MAERYDEQYRNDRGQRRDDRGLMERAGDEVRSWFGDEDAERRRQVEDPDRDRNRYRDRDRMLGQSSEYGRNADRGDRGYGDRNTTNQHYGDRGYGDRNVGDRNYLERNYGPGEPSWTGEGSRGQGFQGGDRS